MYKTNINIISQRKLSEKNICLGDKIIRLVLMKYFSIVFYSCFWSIIIKLNEIKTIFEPIKLIVPSRLVLQFK